MSLHGLSHDAWGRYSGGGKWDYRILAPGFKYNLTDVAAAIGIHQLARAEAMRRRARERRASILRRARRASDELELPPTDANRIHSWHLFPIRLRLDRLDDRPQRVHGRAEGRAASDAPCTGGPSTSIRTTRRPSAGDAAELPRSTRAWERLDQPADLSRE